MSTFTIRYIDINEKIVFECDKEFKDSEEAFKNIAISLADPILLFNSNSRHIMMKSDKILRVEIKE